MLNVYSNSCVGFLVTVESLHIARLVWDDVYFLVLGKLEVWNPRLCLSGEQRVLSCLYWLQKPFPIWRNLGFTCHFSSLTITSLFSGRIFDTSTIRLIYFPNNGHLFTWLKMIQNEWNVDVSSIAIKCGNNCGWKRMSSICSIKDLTVIEWRWIWLFCTGRLNTRQEVWLLPESQLSKFGQRWWVGLVFVH